MIDSGYWRKELRADLAWLRRHRRFRRWTERQQVLFERRLMLVAFQIRALLERPNVDEDASNSYLDGYVYKKVGEDPVTMLNSISFERHFDMENPLRVRLPIRDLCNQLIHHYVMFALRSEHSRFEMVLVFSDYKRNVCLYQFDIQSLLALFSVFASDESAASNVTMRWNEKRQDYVWSTNRR